jgi:hypothetical protein
MLMFAGLVSTQAKAAPVIPAVEKQSLVEDVRWRRPYVRRRVVVGRPYVRRRVVVGRPVVRRRVVVGRPVVRGRAVVRRPVRRSVRRARRW